jgi:hypothetical protein
MGIGPATSSPIKYERLPAAPQSRCPDYPGKLLALIEDNSQLPAYSAPKKNCKGFP